MFFDLVILISSSVFILLLSLGKIWEDKRGEKNLWSRICEKIDSYIHPHVFHVKKILSHFNKDSFRVFLVFVLRVFHVIVSYVGDKIKDSYIRLADAGRARSFLGRKGVASLFLRDVMEYKNKLTREQ